MSKNQSDSGLVVVRTFNSSMAAEVAKTALEGNGIAATVSSDDCGGMQPFLQLARGVRLLVSSEDMDQAKDILDTLPEPSEFDSGG